MLRSFWCRSSTAAANGSGASKRGGPRGGQTRNIRRPRWEQFVVIACFAIVVRALEQAYETVCQSKLNAECACVFDGVVFMFAKFRTRQAAAVCTRLRVYLQITHRRKKNMLQTHRAKLAEARATAAVPVAGRNTITISR